MPVLTEVPACDGGQSVRNDEIPIGCGQPLGARFPDDDGVLDANAELAVQVDTRLHRDDHPWLENAVVACDDGRRFVHLQADAVAGPGEEGVAESCGSDDLSACRVDVVDRRTGDCGADPGCLSGTHDIKDCSVIP